MSSKAYESFFSFREKAARQFGALFAFRWAYLYLGLILIFQAGAWFFAYYIQSHLGGELLILHNNPYFGIDWIATGSSIFILPAWSLGALLLNFVITLALVRHKYGRLFLNFLLGAALLVSVMSLINVFFIYLINFH